MIYDATDAETLVGAEGFINGLPSFICLNSEAKFRDVSSDTHLNNQSTNLSTSAPSKALPFSL